MKKHLNPWSIIALSIVFYFIYRSWYVADYSWDVLAYHMPFSALRVGIISNESFSLAPHLVDSYESFPNLIYYLKGWLWLFFDKPEAMNIISPLSILIFILFCNRELKLSFFWSLCGILSIPVLHVAITSGMTDLTMNVGIAICVLSIYIKLIEDDRRIYITQLLWFLVGALIAVGTKPQAAPIVGIFSLVYFLFLIKNLKSSYHSNTVILTVFGILLISVFYKPFLNFWNFGNPLYPMAFTILGHEFPGVFVTNNWTNPIYLAEDPQPVRWILSVLEYKAFSFREVSYTIGQGDVPVDSPSLNMGGYNISLVISCLGAQLFGAFSLKNKRAFFSFWILIPITIMVSFMPGSHELRYFSFWMIYLVISTLHIYSGNILSSGLNGYGFFVKCSLIAAVIFFVSITGRKYDNMPERKYDDLKEHVSKLNSEITLPDGSICIYGDDSRFAFLRAYYIDSGKVYQRNVAEGCNTFQEEK